MGKSLDRYKNTDNIPVVGLHDVSMHIYAYAGMRKLTVHTCTARTKKIGMTLVSCIIILFIVHACMLRASRRFSSTRRE